MNGLDAALVAMAVPVLSGIGKCGPGLEMLTRAFSSHLNRSEVDVSGVGSEGHFCIPYKLIICGFSLGLLTHG